MSRKKSSQKGKHITKISAKRPSEPVKPAPVEAPKPQPETKLIEKPEKPTKKQSKLAKRQAKQQAKQQKKAAKLAAPEKPLKEIFILKRPFVAVGRYLRDSWRELRQVRWPNRKATWKMTLAVVVYCAVFMVFILLLDMLFSFVFNLLITK